MSYASPPELSLTPSATRHPNSNLAAKSQRYSDYKNAKTGIPYQLTITFFYKPYGESSVSPRGLMTARYKHDREHGLHAVTSAKIMQIAFGLTSSLEFQT